MIFKRDLEYFLLTSVFTGYITFSEAIEGPAEAGLATTPISEFTEMVSRGKLKHPPDWLFHFSTLCYCCFNSLHSPSCASRVQILFNSVAEFYFPSEVVTNNVTRRLTNCFFKGFVSRASKLATDTAAKDMSQRKVMKLRGK